LADADAPAPVRAFIAQKPAWLEVRPNPDRGNDNASDPILDEGERAAIALAKAIRADLILMDDRAGVAIAYRHGLTVTGTLGVLDLAARRGLLDLAAAFAKLRATNFRYPPRSWTRCWRNIERTRRDTTRLLIVSGGTMSR
jgi:predicted nucleic acid-binding protein